MDENHHDKAESKTPATEDQKKRFPKWTGFSQKTLWDWLQLLIIPFVLAVGGFWFTAQQNRASELAAADQRRETTLKTCMNDIRDLLLKNDLATSQRENEVRVVARAEVLSALRHLDGERKGTLIRFLSEARLITSTGGKDPIILLDEADLSGAELNSANLSGAVLSGADLSGAELIEANLSGADLSGANLNSAVLSGADLSGANLSEAKVTKEQLDLAKSLQGATLLDGSKHP